jgi:hypothetical protein
VLTTGGAAPGGASSAGSSIGSILARLLSGAGSSGGASGGSGASSLLQQLLGYGASAGGGALQHNAAVSAANNYANQTKFNPFNINGPSGSTSFNGYTGNSALNPSTQINANDLAKLTQGSATNLAQGNDAEVNGIFNNLQKSQRDSNNRMFQSNLDSQFGNGVLASTAGQYQSQAALDAINKATTNNHITAQNMGTQTQQQQLAQLTAGLTGTNQINTGALDQLKTGLTAGANSSFANDNAYQPSVSANTTSPLGDVLKNFGGNQLNSGNNAQMIQFLRLLLNGG